MCNEDLTLLIDRARQGDANAENLLCDRVYADLRAMAGRIMPHDDTSLQPTMLIGDLFEKFFRKGGLKKTVNRRYFFAVAADQMRNLLVDHYRRKRTQRRGGGRERESLDVVLDNVITRFETTNQTQLNELDEALSVLQQQNERQYQVVMYKFFAGLSGDRIAELLGVDRSTVVRDWKIARMKLFAELSR